MRTCLPFIVLGFLWGNLSDAQSPETIPVPTGERATWQYTGVSSCTAAGCHGAGHANRVEGSEYNIWISEDPHAAAYQTLFDDRSVRMVELLGGKQPANKDARCLACHSITKEYNENLVADGVSCEACHGRASGWLALHYEHGLLAQKPEDREAQYGLWNTDSLVRRTQICADCHVGSPERDVNHDLIAAGHPRLQFEMGAYFAALPKHWSDSKDRSQHGPEFDAVLWAVGQACTSQAALDLLTARAGGDGPWPELAEWSCAACHHDLQDSPARQQRLAEVGGLSGTRLPWDPWNHHLSQNYLEDLVQVLRLDSKQTAGLESEFKELKRNMEQITADRNKAASQSAALAKQMGLLAESLQQADWPESSVDDLSWRIADQHLQSGVYGWSTAAQIYDALASLHQTRLNRSQSAPELTDAMRVFFDGLALRQLSPATYRYDSNTSAEQLSKIRRLIKQEEARDE